MTAAPVSFPRPSPGGLGILIAAALLVVAVPFASRGAPSLLVPIGVAGAVVAIVATHRWPVPMLVVAALMPLLDRGVTRLVLPAEAGLAGRFVGEALLVVVALTIAVEAIRAGHFLAALRHPAWPWIVAFVALQALGAAVNAVPPTVALVGILLTVEAGAFVFLPRMIPLGERTVTIAVGSVVALLTVAAGLAVTQGLLRADIAGLAVTEGRLGEVSRIGSIAGDPNTLGILLALALPFALFGALRAGTPGLRRAALAVATVLFVGLWLSTSRGAWLASGVSLLTVGLLLERRLVLLAGLLGTVTFAGAVMMPRDLLGAAPTEPVPTIAPVPTASGAPTATPVPSATPAPTATPTPAPDLIGSTIGRVARIALGSDLRTQLVLNGLPILADHPLVGVGPGRYGGAAADIFGTPIHDRYGTADLLVYEIGWKRFHVQHTVDNFWLHLVVESGILGTLAFVGALVAIGRPLAASARNATGRRFVLSAGALGALLAISVNSVTTMGLESNIIAFPALLLIGLAGALAASPAPERAA